MSPGAGAEEPAVLAEGVRKSYRGGGAVLDGLDLRVAPGSVHGLLGPNGAGKTTAVRILATLLGFDTGRVRVAGCDVAREPARVRGRIGLAGQHAALDEVLSGRQNLEMFARLHHLRPRAATRRASVLLERFDLCGAADRAVRHYSGGMRRRLDLAVSLIRGPRVLFLDEPTTGLDPRSRMEVWHAVRELAAAGTTVLLTTQYLEEADRLCGWVSLVDRGRVVAEGTPQALKARVGGTRVDIAVPPGRDLHRAVRVLGSALGEALEVEAETRRISLALCGGAATLGRLAGALDEAGVGIEDVALRRPDLDEVFLRLTEAPSRAGGAR